mmetsp:Transcript_30148/g.44327  ORF Transcript_30148/g.44327 Transcript_30148/m.44327 type:complete len:234 (-) Transcript_30148:2234-2935(-)
MDSAIIPPRSKTICRMLLPKPTSSTPTNRNVTPVNTPRRVEAVTALVLWKGCSFVESKFEGRPLVDTDVSEDDSPEDVVSVLPDMDEGLTWLRRRIPAPFDDFVLILSLSASPKYVGSSRTTTCAVLTFFFSSVAFGFDLAFTTFFFSTDLCLGALGTLPVGVVSAFFFLIFDDEDSRDDLRLRLFLALEFSFCWGCSSPLETDARRERELRELFFCDEAAKIHCHAFSLSMP